MSGAIRRAALCAAMMTLGSVSPPARAATNGGCELHVWAAPGMGRTLQTAGDNLLIYLGGMAVADPRQRVHDNTARIHTQKLVTDGQLSTAAQLTTLERQDLPKLLGIPDYRVVVHPEPLDSRTVREVANRYAVVAAPCYADFVLSDVVYSREYSHGQNLKSYFHFRDFADQPIPRRRLATWVETKLSVRREDPKADLAASDAEIEVALGKNAQKFAVFLGASK